MIRGGVPERDRKTARALEMVQRCTGILKGTGEYLKQVRFLLCSTKRDLWGICSHCCSIYDTRL